MRATFTTSFIYDGIEGYMDRKKKLSDILDIELNSKGGSVIGQLAGVTKGLHLSESDIKDEIEQLVYDLSQVATVPFKIVWLFEGGDIVIKDIVPKPPKKAKK